MQKTTFRFRHITTLALMAILALVTTFAVAQPSNAPPKPSKPPAKSGHQGQGHRHGHGRAHGHGHGHSHGHGKARGVRRVPPSPEQITKRLARIKKRWTIRRTQRVQRRHDRRRALRRRLKKRLRGTALTPAMILEMRQHAHRVARLRRIKFIAAEEADYDTVTKVDRLLARENARNSRWWIDTSRQIAKRAIEEAKKQ